MFNRKTKIPDDLYSRTSKAIYDISHQQSEQKLNQTLDYQENSFIQRETIYLPKQNKKIAIWALQRILLVILISGFFLLLLFITDQTIKQQKQKQEKQSLELLKEQERIRIQSIEKLCYKKDLLKRKVFFLSYDLQNMQINSASEFQQINKLCEFDVLEEITFKQFVETWNQLQEQFRYHKSYINSNDLREQKQRELFVWLAMYFKSGIYIHASLGCNFGEFIDDRYLIHAQVGKQILFAKQHYQNSKGIFVPQRSFKTVRVDIQLSDYVKKIIQKIIAGQDWLDLCQTHQCIIIKNAIRFSEKN